jgi:hypothetical protein
VSFCTSITGYPIIKGTLDKDLSRAQDAAGKDAFYALMAGGIMAPEGHSCVSIVSDALCYGDKEGAFKTRIDARITLPTPAAFSDLVPGNIGDDARGRGRTLSG